MLEDRVDGRLADWVARRRATDSWTAIAIQLTHATGIEVSDETLRRWFASRVRVVIEQPAEASA